jgi:nucleotide-binding universal stress UspA family protein
MKDHFQLLIGYDGSSCSDAALEDLKRAGLPRRVEAVVMTVAHVFLPEDEVADDELLSPEAAALMAHSQADATKAIEHALAIAKQGASRVKSDFPDWKVTADAEGDSPSWGLIKMAERLDSDLVVVGSHGHSSAGGRLILGSVSLRVLYEASCSVRVARCSTDRRDGPVRIVVGFDGSKASDAAVNSVASRWWPEGSEVRVITAREASRPEERSIRLQKLHEAGLIAVEISKDGEPAHVLVQEASEWGADSIFVGTRNLHGFQHLLQGSVSSAVAAHARCSVEVVRTATAVAAA